MSQRINIEGKDYGTLECQECGFSSFTVILVGVANTTLMCSRCKSLVQKKDLDYQIRTKCDDYVFVLDVPKKPKIRRIRVEKD